MGTQPVGSHLEMNQWSIMGLKALTIRERLDKAYEHLVYGGEELSASRWKQMVNEVASGDERVASRIYQQLGYEPHRLKSVLGQVYPSKGIPLPFWAKMLKSLLQKVKAEQIELPQHLTDPKVPFSDFLGLLVWFASNLIKDKALCEKDALRNLEAALLLRLSRIAGPTLHYEFMVFEASSILASQSGFAPQDNATGYGAFIRWLQSGGASELFSQYPVLARLLGTVVSNWIDFVSEFLRRLSSDFKVICNWFNISHDSRLIDIHSSLSDHHQGGREVLFADLSDGTRIVYKPRSINVEENFCALLDKLNSAGCPFLLRPYRLLSRENYGWAEYISPSSNLDQAGMSRFYQRVGGLLALLHLLDGTDCHQENLIACADDPVLVDTETLFHPKRRERPPRNAMMIAKELLTESVLKCSLLPEWKTMGMGSTLVGSAGLSDRGASFVSTQVWKNINSPEMTLARIETPTYKTRSLPKLIQSSGGEFEFSKPFDYVDEICHGFRGMLEFVILNKPLTNNLIETFRNVQTRFIFRPTDFYNRLLSRLRHPKVLKDGADWSIAMAPLFACCAYQDRPVGLGPLIDSELRALELLDVPVIRTKPSSSTIDDTLSNYNARRIFHPLPLSACKNRLKSLSLPEILKQERWIRAAFKLEALECDHLGEKTLVEPTDRRVLSHSEFRRVATVIANDLINSAIWGEDFSCSWVEPRQVKHCHKLRFQPIDYSFYSGCSGISVFMAALVSSLQANGVASRYWAKFERIAYAALIPLRAQIHSKLRRGELISLGIGGGVGLGGLIYSLSTVGALMNDQPLIDDALELVSMITQDHILADTLFDVMNGSAGLALVCSSLYRRFPKPILLEIAMTAANHVRRNSRMLENMTGFAHGSAGAIYALVRLYELTQDAELLESAAQMMENEDNFFHSGYSNWAYTAQEGSTLRFGSSWCHGSPGILLSRIAAAQIAPRLLEPEKFNRCLKIFSEWRPARFDGICCGNAGRAGVLLSIGRYLNDSEIVVRSRQIISQICSPEKHGFRYLGSADPLVKIHSLFRGAAGIGYELLRAIRKELPNIMIFE